MDLEMTSMYVCIHKLFSMTDLFIVFPPSTFRINTRSEHVVLYNFSTFFYPSSQSFFLSFSPLSFFLPKFLSHTLPLYSPLSLFLPFSLSYFSL